MSFSVCIPRIFNNIPTSKIVNTFERIEYRKSRESGYYYEDW